MTFMTPVSVIIIGLFIYDIRKNFLWDQINKVIFRAQNNFIIETLRNNKIDVIIIGFKNL